MNQSLWRNTLTAETAEKRVPQLDVCSLLDIQRLSYTTVPP